MVTKQRGGDSQRNCKAWEGLGAAYQSDRGLGQRYHLELYFESRTTGINMWAWRKKKITVEGTGLPEEQWPYCEHEWGRM